MSRNKHSNDIRTPRSQVKVGQRVQRGSEPVAYIKQNGKEDTLSLSEFAETLYGPGTTCVVYTPKK